MPAASLPPTCASQWFVKDMAGMAGGVLLASSQGAGFDCYAKQWRLFADVVNDVGASFCDVSSKFVLSPASAPVPRWCGLLCGSGSW